ncbi:hypothetical protein K1719_033924 [Acacia pycnantha]|nr:hypothetical protein K1719_033924 [Acacia pycnantha]
MTSKEYKAAVLRAKEHIEAGDIFQIVLSQRFERRTFAVVVPYFHDQFTWLKGLGLFTIIVGVFLFNWYKYWKLQKGEDVSGTFKTDSGTKYVILDKMDEQEENT